MRENVWSVFHFCKMEKEHDLLYLLVIFRSGTQNGKFRPAWFRLRRFTGVDKIHDEWLQMLTFLKKDMSDLSLA